MNAQRENELMLARILGISEEHATEILRKRITVTCGTDDVSSALGMEIVELAGRTVISSTTGECDLEVVVGAEKQTSSNNVLYVSIDEDGLTLSRECRSEISPCHPLLRSIGACYTCAVALSALLGIDKRHGIQTHFDFRALGVTPESLNQRFEFGDDAMVGAGAIANGFLRALRHVDAHGLLVVTDPKRVGAGNVNRCVYFDDESIDKEKALELCRKAQPDFPHLTLKPYVGDLHAYVSGKEAKRVRRVFVGPDSRRARRRVQSELPLEVIDASTSAADEIIVHSHRYPTTGACLACVYAHIPQEDGRERGVAAGLGVDLVDVRKQLIDDTAAAKIVAHHPNLNPAQLVGRAYDSLFKELCSTAALAQPGQEQVLAPFAFVSCLAGALMCIELIRFETQALQDETNYFFTDPWRPPYMASRRKHGKKPACEFCSKPQHLEAMEAVWLDILHKKCAS